MHIRNRSVCWRARAHENFNPFSIASRAKSIVCGQFTAHMQYIVSNVNAWNSRTEWPSVIVVMLSALEFVLKTAAANIESIQFWFIYFALFYSIVCDENAAAKNNVQIHTHQCTSASKILWFALQRASSAQPRRRRRRQKKSIRNIKLVLVSSEFICANLMSAISSKVRRISRVQRRWCCLQDDQIAETYVRIRQVCAKMCI